MCGAVWGAKEAALIRVSSLPLHHSPPPPPVLLPSPGRSAAGSRDDLGSGLPAGGARGLADGGEGPHHLQGGGRGEGEGSHTYIRGGRGAPHPQGTDACPPPPPLHTSCPLHTCWGYASASRTRMGYTICCMPSPPLHPPHFLVPFTPAGGMPLPDARGSTARSAARRAVRDRPSR